jgi:hypothetical protein
LPTLTEVVEPAELSRASTDTAGSVFLEAGALADQITALLEPRTAELVNSLLSEHLRLLESRIYADISLLVRQSVVEALGKVRQD